MPSAGLKFDTVILGAGITGLSTVYHLRRLGVQSIAIAAANHHPPITKSTPGFVTATPIDNFTRTVHRHGLGVATDLWRFSLDAFGALRDHCRAESVPLEVGARLRLATSTPEAKEAELAADQLKSAGFTTSLQTRGDLSDSARFSYGPNIRAVQLEPLCGGRIDVSALMASLRLGQGCAPARLPEVRFINADGQGPIKLICCDGTVVTCEILVLGCHLAIGRLLPELGVTLVSVADQWSEFIVPKGFPPDWRGNAFSAFHGNIWGVFGSGSRVFVGGAKYLRPLGGFEANESSILSAITTHLRNFLGDTFKFAQLAEPCQTVSGLDIRPCDELPIVGPMFGNGRILIATGYMGAGLTLGFYSGRSLAELIIHGRSSGLPRSLWPERLRSLES